jgi:FtsH-binding integral membrane protein
MKWVISFGIPALILGGSSIWWFFTERDGISQMVGLFINGGSLLVIGIINLVFYFLSRHKK